MVSAAEGQLLDPGRPSGSAEGVHTSGLVESRGPPGPSQQPPKSSMRCAADRNRKAFIREQEQLALLGLREAEAYLALEKEQGRKAKLRQLSVERAAGLSADEERSCKERGEDPSTGRESPLSDFPLPIVPVPVDLRKFVASLHGARASAASDPVATVERDIRGGRRVPAEAHLPPPPQVDQSPTAGRPGLLAPSPLPSVPDFWSWGPPSSADGVASTASEPAAATATKFSRVTIPQPPPPLARPRSSGSPPIGQPMMTRPLIGRPLRAPPMMGHQQLPSLDSNVRRIAPVSLSSQHPVPVNSSLSHGQLRPIRLAPLVEPSQRRADICQPARQNPTQSAPHVSDAALSVGGRLASASGGTEARSRVPNADGEKEWRGWGGGQERGEWRENEALRYAEQRGRQRNEHAGDDRRREGAGGDGRTAPWRAPAPWRLVGDGGRLPTLPGLPRGISFDHSRHALLGAEDRARRTPGGGCTSREGFSSADPAGRVAIRGAARGRSDNVAEAPPAAGNSVRPGAWPAPGTAATLTDNHHVHRGNNKRPRSTGCPERYNEPWPVEQVELARESVVAGGVDQGGLRYLLVNGCTSWQDGIPRGAGVERPLPAGSAGSGKLAGFFEDGIVEAVDQRRTSLRYSLVNGCTSRQDGIPRGAGMERPLPAGSAGSGKLAGFFENEIVETVDQRRTSKKRYGAEGGDTSPGSFREASATRLVELFIRDLAGHWGSRDEHGRVLLPYPTKQEVHKLFAAGPMAEFWSSANDLPPPDLATFTSAWAALCSDVALKEQAAECPAPRPDHQEATVGFGKPEADLRDDDFETRKGAVGAASAADAKRAELLVRSSGWGGVAAMDD